MRVGEAVSGEDDGSCSVMTRDRRESLERSKVQIGHLKCTVDTENEKCKSVLIFRHLSLPGDLSYGLKFSELAISQR